MTQITIIAPAYKQRNLIAEYRNKENLSIGYLASYLELKGHSVEMINAFTRNWANDDIVSNLSNDLKLIAISCNNQKLYPTAKELIQKIRIKFPSTHITMGGVFASIEYNNILQDISQLDTIITGEGEYAIHKLAQYIIKGQGDLDSIEGIVFRDNEIIKSIPSKRIINLSDLPYPKRESIGFNKMNNELRRVIAGRGCYGRCAFCSSKNNYTHSGKKYRVAYDIVCEVEELMVKYNTNYFEFSDDIFYERSNKGKQWVNDFVKEVKKKNLKISFKIEMRVNDVHDDEIKMLKEVGLKSVYLGIESGVPRILNELKKDIMPEDAIRAINTIRKYELEIIVGYIAFVPTMSFEELKESYEFLFNTNVFRPENIYNKLNVYNGCDYEGILIDNHLNLPKTHFWDESKYKFKNEKVEKFYKNIKEVQKQLLTVKSMLSEIIILCTKIGNNKKVKYFENLHCTTSRDITNILLKHINDNLEVLPSLLPKEIIELINNLRIKVETEYNLLYLNKKS